MDTTSFPELEQIQSMQRSRFRKVATGLVLGGALSATLGFSIFAAAGEGQPMAGIGAVGVVLIGVGLLTTARGLLFAIAKV